MYVLASIATSRPASGGQRVLVLDDDAVSCNIVVTLLREAGFQPDACSTGLAALEMLSKSEHRVLVADQHRGPVDHLEVARRVHQLYPSVSVVVLAGEAHLEAGVEGLRAGTFDFMTKSFDLSTLAEHLLDAVRRAVDAERRAMKGPSDYATSYVPRDLLRDVLVGECPAIERARQDVRGAAHSDAPALILGEAGTEKIMVARLIHGSSPRHKEPFEIVSTSQQDESADFLKVVRTWSDARHGTLFLTDISSINSVWQMELVKLLSGLGPNPDAPRPRIIAGLSQPPNESWDGSMLARLFERMGGTEVVLPPLRERGRDVVILAEQFAEQTRLARGDASLRITPTALEALTRYSWPGNVDELRFAMQHAASLCADSLIRVVDLPPSVGLSLKGASDESGTRLEVQSLEDMELSYILRVLDAVGGNKASAARLLGVDRTTLYRKLQRQEHGEPVSHSEIAPVRRARR